MVVFLNERLIRFTGVMPESPPPSGLVLEFSSRSGLEAAWADFLRYEKYRSLTVVDPGSSDPLRSDAFAAFTSLFKVIRAGGGLVRNEKGEYLFIHRFGLWDLPKGKVDPGDRPGPDYTDDDPLTARIAAVREVREETGVKSLTVQKSLPPTWHLYQHKEKWILKHTQWFEMEADSGQSLIPATEEGIFLVRWIPPKGIHCILSNTYASLRALLLEIVL